MLDRVTHLPGAPCLLARGTLLGGLSYCHVNSSCRVTRLAEVERPRKNCYAKLPSSSWGILLSLTASGDYAQLVGCKTIVLNTETRPLAERVRKNLNLPPKRFFSPPSCLLCLAAAQKIAHWLSRSGELRVKAGYVLTRLAGAPCLHVNRP